MNDFIVWNTQKLSYVTEEMLPINQDLTAYPPEEWVSNDSWLAVTIDGYKAHICIYTSTTHWGSDKIVIEFMEQHPHFTSDSNFDAQPFMTNTSLYRARNSTLGTSLCQRWSNERKYSNSSYCRQVEITDYESKNRLLRHSNTVSRH